MKYFRFTKILALLLALTLLLSSCALLDIEGEPGGDTKAPAGDTKAPDTKPEDTKAPQTDPADTEGMETTPEETQAPETQPETVSAPDRDGYYYDVKNVVLYLAAYGQLPPNFITKKEAQALGWEGGSVERVKEGAAIGGDRFGNYEGLLPSADGRTWTECDIDTLGYGSRGSRRLVFSNDGLYYYTSDHYESFKEVKITEDGDVIW